MTSRTLILSSFFVAVVLTALGDESITLLPHWKHGEKRRFDMVKRSQRLQEGRVLSKAGHRTSVDIEVLEAGVKGYAIGWTFGETTFDDPKLGEDPIAWQMANLMKGFRIVFELDSGGSVLRVRNREEVVELVAKSADLMGQGLARGIEDPATAEQVREHGRIRLHQWLAQPDGRDQVCKAAAPEAQMLFGVLGRTYRLRERTSLDLVLPVPLSKEVLRGKASFVMKTLDRKSNTAIIVHEEIFDVPSERGVANEKKDPPEGRPGGLPSPQTQGKMQISSEYTVNPSSGWILRLARKQTSSRGLEREEYFLGITARQ